MSRRPGSGVQGLRQREHGTENRAAASFSAYKRATYQDLCLCVSLLSSVRGASRKKIDRAFSMGLALAGSSVNKEKFFAGGLDAKLSPCDQRRIAALVTGSIDFTASARPCARSRRRSDGSQIRRLIFGFCKKRFSGSRICAVK
jgi:hypothetical protein